MKSFWFFDLPLQTPEINSVKGALNFINKLAEFSDWQENEELSRDVLLNKDVLPDDQLRSLKQTSKKVAHEGFDCTITRLLTQ